MTNFSDDLVRLGLTSKEAEIYLALVRYGASRAMAVSKRVRINRTLVYALLQNLVQKGYVEETLQNEKAIFSPVEPEIFLRKAKQQLNHANLLVESIRNIELVNNQPVIRSFQGIDGIRQMVEIFLEEAKYSRQGMLQIGQEVRLAEEYPDLIEEFIRKRLLYKIPLKLLCNKSPIFEPFLNEERTKKELREIKFVDEKDLSVDCTTYICGDSVVVISLANEMQGYILKSKNIADLNRQMFFLLWNKV